MARYKNIDTSPPLSAGRPDPTRQVSFFFEKAGKAIDNMVDRKRPAIPS